MRTISFCTAGPGSSTMGTTSGFGGDIEKALKSIMVPILYMPSATDLYFPLTDARYEAGFIKRVTFKPIPLLWGNGRPWNRSCGCTISEHRDQHFGGHALTTSGPAIKSSVRVSSTEQTPHSAFVQELTEFAVQRRRSCCARGSVPLNNVALPVIPDTLLPAKARHAVAEPRREVFGGE